MKLVGSSPTKHIISLTRPSGSKSRLSVSIQVREMPMPNIQNHPTRYLSSRWDRTTTLRPKNFVARSRNETRRISSFDDLLNLILISRFSTQTKETNLSLKLKPRMTFLLDFVIGGGAECFAAESKQEFSWKERILLLLWLNGEPLVAWLTRIRCPLNSVTHVVAFVQNSCH